LAVAFVAAPTRAAHAAEDELTLDLGGSSLELRRIPKGTFTQGSAATDAIHEPDELAHVVTISRSFWLGKVPVTRAQFSKFVTETRFVTDAEKGANGGFGWDGKTLVQKKEFTWRSPGFAQKDEDPVVLVTFADANAFAAWASRKTGKRVRLPTEAEWEYAARAGTTTPWYGANKEDEALALGWFKQNAVWTTHPVGMKKPNAFGLFDMGGNVFEWCRDVYAPYPADAVTDPENTTAAPGEPERRILRGGSWLRDPKRGRSAARHKNAPGTKNADNGFRVAVEDDAAIAPTALAVPSNDVAVASPAGTGSSTSPTSSVDAGLSASAVPVPARAPSEGSPWSLVGAPVAGAAIVVAWVLARRRRGGPSTVKAPLDVAGASNLTSPPAPQTPMPSELDVRNERSSHAPAIVPRSPSLPPAPPPVAPPSPAIPASVSPPPLPPLPFARAPSSPSIEPPPSPSIEPPPPPPPPPIAPPSPSIEPPSPSSPFARSPSAPPPSATRLPAPVRVGAPPEKLADEMSIAEASMRTSIAQGLGDAKPSEAPSTPASPDETIEILPEDIEEASGDGS
jgi:formylglycine-generating enzyme required for sulfatase activity